MGQFHFVSRACIVQKTMVVLLHFLLAQKAGPSARGPDLCPKTQKWVPSFQSSRSSCPPKVCSHFAHKRTHEYSTHAGRVAGMPQHSKSKYHCRGGKSVPGNETEKKVKAAQNEGPLWREIKLLCVVYATRQGTGISCAPPKPSLFPALPPHRPRMPSYPPCGDGIRSGVFNELFA